MEIKIRSATTEDLGDINSVLSEWLSLKEVAHYLDLIKQSIEQSPGSLKFDSHFFVAESDKKVIGLAGFRKLLPKLIKFSNTNNPSELSMIYVSNKHRGGKVGTTLLNEIIEQTKNKNYTELIVRSSDRFIKTGWGFYDKFPGMKRVRQMLPPESEGVMQIWTKDLKD